MKIKNLDFGFPLILIDNYYSEEELSLIWEELNFLGKTNVLYDGNNVETKSALSSAGLVLKNNYSVFLDELFSYDRNFSNILKVNRKLFNEWNNIIKQNNHWFYKNFSCQSDTTLLSYYENKNSYNLHSDASVITSLSWFYKEPKKFQGGNLFFENGEEVEVLNNRMVIFPSMIKHGVREVIMQENDLNKKNGRFCITQFLFYRI